VPTPVISIYNATKFGLRGFALALRNGKIPLTMSRAADSGTLAVRRPAQSR